MAARNPKSFRRSAQSGQAIVLIAFAMIGLMAFMVLAIDGSKYLDSRRETQNASDMAALAGMHYYFNTTGATNSDTLKEINRVAEINGIPDTDSTPHDAINGNTQAWWVDKNGVVLGTIDNSSGTAPSGTAGVKVQVQYQYVTFTGQLIGQNQLSSQADGVALQSLSTSPDPGMGQKSMWIGGGNCGNNAFNIGSGKNTNSFDLGSGGGFVNGGGTVSSNNQNSGPVDFSGSVTGSGLNDVTPMAPNPNAPSTQPFPNWAYMTVNGQPHLLQAVDFEPTIPNVYGYNGGANIDGAPSEGTGTGQVHNNDWFLLYVQEGANPAGYFHYVKNPSATDGVANATQLKSQMDTEGDGIYFVDGPVIINWFWTGNQALVATGQVSLDIGNGAEPYAATSSTNPWGKNISILAGATPPSGKSACATTDPTQWWPAFDAGGGGSGHEQAGWGGILYVPNGLAADDANWNGGHTLGPVIAYSFGAGMGNPPDVNAQSTNSNSLNFGPCGSLCDSTNFTYNLQQ